MKSSQSPVVRVGMGEQEFRAYLHSEVSGLLYEMQDGSYHFVYRHSSMRMEEREMWSETYLDWHSDLFPMWNVICGQMYDFHKDYTIWLPTNYRVRLPQMCLPCLHQRLLLAMRGD